MFTLSIYNLHKQARKHTEVIWFTQLMECFKIQYESEVSSSLCSCSDLLFLATNITELCARNLQISVLECRP